MPNVLATPIKQNDGSTVMEFTDATSTTAVTYTYPASQSKLVVTNQGLNDITVTVGTQSNIVVKPNETKEFTASFTTFQIKSTVNSQAFKATAIVSPTAVDTSLLATKAEVAATYQTIALAETKANAAATYGKVKTVNGTAPDAAGNVTITTA